MMWITASALNISCGRASITCHFRLESDSRVITFTLHGARSFPKTMHGNMQLQNLEINNNYICIVFLIVLLIFSTWFIKMSDFWCFHQFLSQSPASPPVSCCTARVSCSVHGSCSGYMGGWGMLRKSWDRRNGFLVDLPWIFHCFYHGVPQNETENNGKSMVNPLVNHYLPHWRATTGGTLNVALKGPFGFLSTKKMSLFYVLKKNKDHV